MNEILHPCFDETALGYRIHLPIAEKCNTKCNYCKMAFSKCDIRPGVTEELLRSSDIDAYVNESLKIYDDCRIVGIAGPGDPLANPKEVFYALERISKNYPNFKKCMCTNGFGVEDYADKIKEVGLDYITLTINSINECTLSKIYKFIYYHGEYYKGKSAGQLILKLQKSALHILNRFENIKIKINIVFIPGINDMEIDDLIQFLCKYKIDIINIVPLLPVNGTEYESIKPLTYGEFDKIKKDLQNKYKKVRFKQNCQRCRSDARGKVTAQREGNNNQCSFGYAGL
ncbi:MAG: radical SAM protein [Oscillospiraceae bacterium]|nr:radical SAM protein [Oscillospiraceae bacterium]